ncbi:MAG: protein-glutamate methylesterase/protein-glutamine glutaminase [Fibrobacterota bacterium]
MIKVLVIDDSAIVRQVLARELAKQKDITVVGTAPDPFVAREMIIKHRPSVLTLDIEMPRMDGLTFLRKIMKYHPIPTIIVSSVTGRGSKVALEALSYGAYDITTKPGAAYSVNDVVEKIVGQIRAAASTDVKKLQRLSASSKIQRKLSLAKTTQKVVIIGGSTGATVALEKILLQLPANAPGIAVVIHMPPGFTRSFAQRLNEICAVSVKEAESGDRIITGQVLLAPGNYHMEVRRRGAVYSVVLNQKERRFFQRPCVDLLFRSAAHYIGANAVAVMLTGMGKDGAEAMVEMVKNGASAIIQDRSSSVVWGMPGEAYKCGAADKTVPLSKIAETILSRV